MEDQDFLPYQCNFEKMPVVRMEYLRFSINDKNYIPNTRSEIDKAVTNYRGIGGSGRTIVLSPEECLSYIAKYDRDAHHTELETIYTVAGPYNVRIRSDASFEISVNGQTPAEFDWYSFGESYKYSE